MTTANGKNPLKFDPELKAMLDKLDFIKTARTFKRWRTSFLNKFETFLEEEGVKNAQHCYTGFSKNMETFVKQVAKVDSFVQKGDLTVEKYFASVKARNCLNEMAKMMTNVIDELDNLIPSTIALEKKRGYNKFHMGAVLVRDDFKEYGRLTACRNILQHMRKDSLNEVCDKQILAEMDNFGVKLEKFCDVMADLGMASLAKKCIEFAEEGTGTDDIIFLDLKTGGIGELSREDCMQKRILNRIGEDEAKNDVFKEACSDEDKEKTIKMIKESTKLGLGFGIAVNTFDEEDIQLAEAERVKNLWGIKLKKTPKNKKGEELIFLDRNTKAFGELARKMCIEHGILNEGKDGNGKSIIEEAEHEHEERSSLVEEIRALLDLGVSAPKDAAESPPAKVSKGPM